MYFIIIDTDLFILYIQNTVCELKVQVTEKDILLQEVGKLGQEMIMREVHLLTCTILCALTSFITSCVTAEQQTAKEKWYT